MKKFLILSLAATLLCAPQQEVHADWKEGLATGLAVIGGALCIGSGIYLATRELPHAEEIARAKRLKWDAKSEWEKCNSYYQEDMRLIPDEDPRYLSSRTLHRFSQHIQISNRYKEFPFLSYKWKLDSYLYDMDCTISKIESKRTHLRKRQSRLAQDKELSYSEQCRYRRDYENVLEDLLYQKRKLKGQCTRIDQIRTTVITLRGYREDVRAKKEKDRREEERRRQERSERKIRKLNRDIENLVWKLRLAREEAREEAYRRKLERRLRKLYQEKQDLSLSINITYEL